MNGLYSPVRESTADCYDVPQRVQNFRTGKNVGAECRHNMWSPASLSKLRIVRHNM